MTIAEEDTDISLLQKDTTIHTVKYADKNTGGVIVVKKLGKRKRKALAKAKRQKGLKNIPTDHFTKLLYVGEELRKLAKENNVDYCKLSDLEEEDGEYWGTRQSRTFWFNFFRKKRIRKGRRITALRALN